VKIPNSAKGQSDAKPYTLEFQPGPTAHDSSDADPAASPLATALAAHYLGVSSAQVPSYTALLVNPTLGPGTVRVS
jgi:hypothetical protein